jgi:hypothetical protein
MALVPIQLYHPIRGHTPLDEQIARLERRVPRNIGSILKRQDPLHGRFIHVIVVVVADGNYVDAREL